MNGLRKFFWAYFARIQVSRVKLSQFGVARSVSDGTFFSNKEINFRDVKEIPHPFIEDSVKLFDQILSLEDRNKIYFTHLNHTNPLWNKESDEYANLIGKGYRIAEQNQIFRL